MASTSTSTSTTTSPLGVLEDGVTNNNNSNTDSSTSILWQGYEISWDVMKSTTRSAPSALDGCDHGDEVFVMQAVRKKTAPMTIVTTGLWQLKLPMNQLLSLTQNVAEKKEMLLEFLKEAFNGSDPSTRVTETTELLELDDENGGGLKLTFTHGTKFKSTSFTLQLQRERLLQQPPTSPVPVHSPFTTTLTSPLTLPPSKEDEEARVREVAAELREKQKDLQIQELTTKVNSLQSEVSSLKNELGSLTREFKALQASFSPYGTSYRGSSIVVWK